MTDSAITTPSVAPVASAGVIRPPTAPARRKTAVRRGLRIRIAPAAAMLRSRSTLTSRTLEPLPGSSGSQCEHTPTSRPADPSAGISSQVFPGPRSAARARARVISALNAIPTPTVTGASSTTTTVSRYDSCGFGHCRAGPSLMNGAATTTAMPDVTTAVITARISQVRNTIRSANNAPPIGTPNTAASPAPAAQPSRISRSRAVSAQREVPRSPSATANCRGAFSRPSDAPAPTSRTCTPASAASAVRGSGAGAVIASSTVRTRVRRRSSHQPRPARTPPIIGPNACRIGLAPDTPSSRLP